MMQKDCADVYSLTIQSEWERVMWQVNWSIETYRQLLKTTWQRIVCFVVTWSCRPWLYMHVWSLTRYFKVVYTTFSLVCFLSLKENSLEIRKKKIFSLQQKLFSFSRKSNFRIPDIQISWRHQMSKQKTRNIFY